MDEDKEQLRIEKMASSDFEAEMDELCSRSIASYAEMNNAFKALEDRYTKDLYLTDIEMYTIPQPESVQRKALQIIEIKSRVRTELLIRVIQSGFEDEIENTASFALAFSLDYLSIQIKRMTIDELQQAHKALEVKFCSILISRDQTIAWVKTRIQDHLTQLLRS